MAPNSTSDFACTVLIQPQEELCEKKGGYDGQILVLATMEKHSDAALAGMMKTNTKITVPQFCFNRWKEILIGLKLGLTTAIERTKAAEEAAGEL